MAWHYRQDALPSHAGCSHHSACISALQGQVLHPGGAPALPKRTQHEGPWQACEVAHTSQSTAQVRGSSKKHLQQVRAIVNSKISLYLLLYSTLSHTHRCPDAHASGAEWESVLRCNVGVDHDSS